MSASRFNAVSTVAFDAASDEPALLPAVDAGAALVSTDSTSMQARVEIACSALSASQWNRSPAKLVGHGTPTPPQQPSWLLQKGERSEQLQLHLSPGRASRKPACANKKRCEASSDELDRSQMLHLGAALASSDRCLTGCSSPNWMNASCGSGGGS